MKRKLKKVLLMVSLVLMMGLVGCGCGSVAEKPLEIIADFVGRQVDPSASISVYGRERDISSFPTKLHGGYVDEMSVLNLVYPSNTVYFDEHGLFDFLDGQIIFSESYENLILKFSDSEFISGTIDNIVVDKDSLKLYDIDIELNGVSGNFKYNRNAFNLKIKCNVTGKRANGTSKTYNNITVPLYGSFYVFSKNVKYFQVSTDVRGYFVDPSSVSIKKYGNLSYYNKTFENGIVYTYVPGLKRNGSIELCSNEIELDNIEQFSGNVSFEREMSTYKFFKYKSDSNGSYTISVPADTFVEITNNGKLIELNNQFTVGDRSYYEYNLLQNSEYYIVVQSFDDILLDNEISRTERFEIFKGGINLIEFYGQNIYFKSDINNIDYLARFDINGIINLSVDALVNVTIVDSKGNVIYNGINSKNFVFSVIKGEKYSILIKRNTTGTGISFNFTKPSC